MIRKVKTVSRLQFAIALAAAFVSLPAAAQDNRPTRPTQESENIRWAERFPGGDLGARINAADADLGKKPAKLTWAAREPWKRKSPSPQIMSCTFIRRRHGRLESWCRMVILSLVKAAHP